MVAARIRALLELPSAELGPALLSLTENQWFDRKSKRIAAKHLADAIVAMANAEGGILVIGLSEGRVEGIDGCPQNLRNAWRQAALDFVVPPLRTQVQLLPCFNEHDKPDHLFVLWVEPSSQVHANRRDEVLLRVGDENRRLTFAQRQELMFEKGQASFEAAPVGPMKSLELTEGLLERYAEALGHEEARRLLQARGLSDANGMLTNAGLLLFGKHPQHRLPEAYIRVVRYRGSERGTGSRQQLVEDQRCEGPVPHQIDKAQEAIEGLIPQVRRLDTQGRFRLHPVVPRDAWLEGLVNAAIHRSYSNMGDHIRVEIFDDRIEISSPGRFPGLVDPNDSTGVPRFARNPRIARACSELGYGQELGEGIRRITEEMKRAGLVAPIYRQTAGSVRLILSAESTQPGVESNLSGTALTVLNTLRLAGPNKTGRIVEETNLSRPTVLRELRSLQELGLVEWVGKSKRDPRAFWRLKAD